MKTTEDVFLVFCVFGFLVFFGFLKMYLHYVASGMFVYRRLQRKKIATLVC